MPLRRHAAAGCFAIARVRVLTSQAVSLTKTSACVGGPSFASQSRYARGRGRIRPRALADNPVASRMASSRFSTAVSSKAGSPLAPLVRVLRCGGPLRRTTRGHNDADFRSGARAHARPRVADRCTALVFGSSGNRYAGHRGSTPRSCSDLLGKRPSKIRGRNAF